MVKGHNNQEFISQFSFAGTITSIILSVIAIWMSITGERSTNEIKDKIVDTAYRLDENAYKIEDANKELSMNLDIQKQHYEEMQKILSEVTEKLEGVRVDFKDYTNMIMDQNLFKGDIKKTEETIYNMQVVLFLYDNIEKGMNNDGKYLLGIMLKYLLDNRSEKDYLDFTDKYIEQRKEYDTAVSNAFVGIMLGIYHCFSKFNYSKDDIRRQLFERMENSSAK